MFEVVREFLPPEIYLGFDANNGYSVSTAIQQGRKFEALGINHFEEPHSTQRFAWTQASKRRTGRGRFCR